MPQDRQIYVRRGRWWWIGSGRWTLAAEEPPLRALRFSSLYWAQRDVGRFDDGSAEYVEMDRDGKWQPAAPDVL